MNRSLIFLVTDKNRLIFYINLAVMLLLSVPDDFGTNFLVGSETKGLRTS